MKLHHFENMSIEEMISEAIDRELSLLAYYRAAAACAGGEGAKFFASCCNQQEHRIAALEALLVETEGMRGICESMTD